MKPVTSFVGRLAPLPFDDIDTDQIIPARFLKVTDRDGLGERLFNDWRREEDGELAPGFPLNRPRHRGASILVTGGNFGCGSSREHAPWALLAAGFRAVVSTDFADIFRNNALKNGLVPVAVPPAIRDSLLETAEAVPDSEARVDLNTLRLTLPEGTEVPFEIDGFARHCLLHGTDELGFLLSIAEVLDYERRHPPRVDTRSGASSRAGGSRP